MTDPKKAKRCADRLQGIAEPTRIRIIDCLLSGPKNVSELAKMLKVEIVNVSHHLGVMRQAGLVEDEKQGRFVIYSLHPDFSTKKSGGSTTLELGWCTLNISGE